MVQVSSPYCNSFHFDPQANGVKEGETVVPKNLKNVIDSSIELKNATYRAIKEGYFPIVFGGDHSQALGSLSGYKKMHPFGRIIWIDAHIDANTPSSSPSRNFHGMPLAFLSGNVPGHKNWHCLDMDRDICYFGIRSFEEEERQYILTHKCLVFESEHCIPTNSKIDKIHKDIHTFFR